MSKILLSCRPRGHIEIFLDYIGIIFKKFRKILWNYLTNVPLLYVHNPASFERYGQERGGLRLDFDGGFGRARQSDFEGLDVGKGRGYSEESRRLRRDCLQGD